MTSRSGRRASSEDSSRTATAVEVAQLAKTCGARVAVDGISFATEVRFG